MFKHFYPAYLKQNVFVSFFFFFFYGPINVVFVSIFVVVVVVIAIKTGSNALMYKEANVITEQGFSGLVPDLCIAH